MVIHPFYAKFVLLCSHYTLYSSHWQLAVRNNSELLLLGERLRNRRTALDLTQEAVANQVDISLRFYQMIERGERKVSLDTLIGLSKTLNISIDFLLFGDVARTLDNPMSAVLDGLSSHQKADALKILQLYAAACH